MSTPRMIVVCLPDDSDSDWFSASEILDHHDLPSGTPYPIYPVRRRPFDWLTRRVPRHLIRPQDRGGMRFAAGGRRRDLDWGRAVTDAANLAAYRWREWARVVHGLPPARPMAQFTTKVKGARGLTGDEARRQFEQQPRVIAMLAYNSNPLHPHKLDPGQLEALQAGEQAYIVLNWQYAVAGDMVITADGDLLRPASASLADRLRYLAKATAYLSGVGRRQQVLALSLADGV